MSKIWHNKGPFWNIHNLKEPFESALQSLGQIWWFTLRFNGCIFHWTVAGNVYMLERNAPYTDP